MPHAPAPSLATAVLSLVTLMGAGTGHAQGSRGHLTDGLFAITGAAVLPMTSETVVENAVVVVRDGRIEAVGPSAKVKVPSGARRIDGRGKYLIPGLADMHTHLYSDDPATPDSLAPRELDVMIANGVTAARLMIGTPEHLRLPRGRGRPAPRTAAVGGEPAFRGQAVRQRSRGDHTRQRPRRGAGGGRRGVRLHQASRCTSRGRYTMRSWRKLLAAVSA